MRDTIIVGAHEGSYAFTGATKTVVITGLSFNPVHESVLLITNISKDVTVYCPTEQLADGITTFTAASGGCTIVMSDDITMADADVLHIQMAKPIASVDLDLDVTKTSLQNPPPAHRKTVEHYATLTVGAPTLYYYPIPADTYTIFSFDQKYTMGAGSTAVVKAYFCDDPDENISTITIANWHDISEELIGAASLACGAGAITKEFWFIDTPSAAEYYLIEVNYTDSADSIVDIKVKCTF